MINHALFLSNNYILITSNHKILNPIRWRLSFDRYRDVPNESSLNGFREFFTILCRIDFVIFIYMYKQFWYDLWILWRNLYGEKFHFTHQVAYLFFVYLFNLYLHKISLILLQITNYICNEYYLVFGHIINKTVKYKGIKINNNTFVIKHSYDRGSIF